MASEIRYEIKEYVGTIAKRKSGWSRELNIVSWNGQPPKYDLREWSEDHSHMGKGVTLFADEMRALVNAYTKYRNRRVVDDAKADEVKRNEQYWADRNARNYSNNNGASSDQSEVAASDQLEVAASDQLEVEASDQGTLPVDGLTDEELEAAVALSHDGAESACAEASTPF